MNRKLSSSLLLVIGMLSGTALMMIYSFDKVDKNEGTVDVKLDGRLQYKWYAPEAPKSMNFAGEKVPLERAEVREGLERELTVHYYGHSMTLYILKNVTRFFPIIEARLKANGVPDDFKYLCVAESSLMNSTSRAGAVGFWQFVDATAPRYGLTINDEVDERYNVAKSTDAACKYFKQSYEKFGSWTAAAASYNCGQAGFNNFSGYQNSTDYYDILLPEETMRYVYRILALKYIITNADKVGFIIEKQDQLLPYKTTPLVVDSTIPDMQTFAVANGTTYKMLKLCNPWLRAHSLTVKPGKSYTIDMPVQK